MLTALASDSIDALVAGTALLGSGGGGSPGHITHPLRSVWDGRRHPVVTLGDLDLEATVIPVGVIGSTQVFDEKLPGGGELKAAVAAVQRWTSTTADAVMGTEGGGLNGLTGLLAAIELELPYLDADLMGRALPRLDQFSSAVAGLPVTPCAISEPGGQVMVIDGVTAPDLERTARAIVSTTGGWGILALPPISVDQLTNACVVGSLNRALRLGRAALSLPPSPPPETLASALDCQVLASGRVIDLIHRPIGEGFGRGSVTLIDTATQAVVRLETENEYLLAMADGEVVSTCPDIITVLDRRTSAPVQVEALRHGIEVSVVVMSGPGWWLHPDRIGYVGPRAFGLDVEPVVRQL